MPKQHASIGNIPSEANSGGALNASVSNKERSGKPLSDLGEGPRVGERGEYLPARYKLPSGRVREDR